MSGRAELRFFLSKSMVGFGLGLVWLGKGEGKGTKLLLFFLYVVKSIEGGFRKSQMWNRGRSGGVLFIMPLEMPYGFVIRTS